jgi:dihydrodipicolinate synthase/N-acetylneuraminate lyase
MRTATIQAEDLRGVFAVPPLARTADAIRALDFDQNDLIVRHLKQGGIKQLIYGGNAFLYHLTLAEYEQLLDWLTNLDVWAIPSAGPDYGRAMDQATLLRHYRFPCVMMLPCSDPREAGGLERGYREFAAAADTKLILYLKDEENFGRDRDAGLDAVARLVDDGVCAGIKYAVVRADPSQDAYLENLLRRVDRKFVISGIGERPAIVHLRDWQLPGFTTGSGCVAPQTSRRLFEACAKRDFDQAERWRSKFIPLEDLRDSFGPAKVLHSAVELAGIAQTGAVPPYMSLLSPSQLEILLPVARNLFDRDSISGKLQLVASTQQSSVLTGTTN